MPTRAGTTPTAARTIATRLVAASQANRTAINGARLGRIAIAIADATPAPSGYWAIASHKAVVHAAVTGTSLIGFISWWRNTGLAATSRAPPSAIEIGRASCRE